MSATSQYATGSARGESSGRYRATGKSVDSLNENDLAPVEHFHTLGLCATESLVELAGSTAEDRVLDAGGGIGGTARFLVRQIDCRVTSIDLRASIATSRAG